MALSGGARPLSGRAQVAASASTALLVGTAVLLGPSRGTLVATVLALQWVVLVWGISRFRAADHIFGIADGRRGTTRIGSFAPLPPAHPLLILVGTFCTAAVLWWAMGSALRLGSSDLGALAALLLICWGLVAYLIASRYQTLRDLGLLSLWHARRRGVAEACAPRGSTLVGSVRAGEPCDAPDGSGECVAWCSVLEIGGKLLSISDLATIELRGDGRTAVIEPQKFALGIRVEVVADSRARERVLREWEARLGYRVEGGGCEVFFGRIAQDALVEVSGEFTPARRAGTMYRDTEAVAACSNGPVLLRVP